MAFRRVKFNAVQSCIVMNPQTLSGCNVIQSLKPSSPDPWFWLCCGVLLVHVSHKLSCWWNARLVELKYFSADWRRCVSIWVYHFRPEQNNQACLQKLSQVSPNRICTISEEVPKLLGGGGDILLFHEIGIAIQKELNISCKPCFCMGFFIYFFFFLNFTALPTTNECLASSFQKGVKISGSFLLCKPIFSPIIQKSVSFSTQRFK